MIKFKQIVGYVFFFSVLLSSNIAYTGSQQISSTSCCTIITNVRSYLNESSAKFWSNEELLVWINDGIIDIATRSKCLDATENITLVAEQLEYTLSTQYIGTMKAVYLDKKIHYYLLQENGDYLLQENNDKLIIADSVAYKGLTRIDIKDVSHTVDPEETEPVHWYEWNGKIGIIPLANTSVDGDAVIIYLVERPSTVGSGENITIPAYFDHILTQYVVARALYKEGKIIKGGQLMAEVHESINRFRVDYMERPKEKDDE